MERGTCVAEEPFCGLSDRGQTKGAVDPDTRVTGLRFCPEERYGICLTSFLSDPGKDFLWVLEKIDFP